MTTISDFRQRKGEEDGRCLSVSMRFGHAYMMDPKAPSANISLTPSLEPFFAGTYFPRERLRTLLLRIKELWDQGRQRCDELGKDAIESMRDLTWVYRSLWSSSLTGLMVSLVQRHPPSRPS